jgi:hypothetical protein
MGFVVGLLRTPKAGVLNSRFPTNFRHQLCIVVHCGANLQRTPSLSFYISITYSCIRSFEPGGREFESLRARQMTKGSPTGALLSFWVSG